MQRFNSLKLLFSQTNQSKKKKEEDKMEDDNYLPHNILVTGGAGFM
jgi:hypothetical protein